jgi:putative transposase
MPEDKDFQLALFRFGLISQLLHVNDRDTISVMIKEISKNEYEIPFSRKKKISAKSIRRYLYAYKQDGFDALKREIRNDKNISRVLKPELLELILNLKREEPARSSNRIIAIIKEDPQWKNEKLSERTIARLLLKNNLTRKVLLPKKIRRSFEMEHINELWQTDGMDGLFIPAKKKKTYLIAFIDDYSRLITHAQFYYDEKLPRLEDCLKKAILKRGIPKAIYADNGKIFVSNHMKIICAELGIRLIHHKPYSPQSKGKIERFFLRVQQEFLLEAEGTNIDSVEQLNSFFQAWLEVSYHRTEHSTTLMTPLDRFTEDMKITTIRKVESLEEITEIFLSREKRKVHNEQGLICVFGNHYRISDASLLKREVEIRFDPFDLSKVFIYHEGKFVQVSYPSSLKNTIQPDIPMENDKSISTVRKSSLEYFSRLKQKELEINKKEALNIDYTKISGETNV